MYIPVDVIELILSFVDKCNNCDIIIINEDFYWNDDMQLICFRCRDNFKLCQNCKNLYECSLYCRFCGSICKYLCKNCVPK